jgi:hypothetical protein
MERTFKKKGTRGGIFKSGAPVIGRGSFFLRYFRKGLGLLLIGFGAILFYHPSPFCRAAEPASPGPQTIVELQPFAQTTSIPILDQRGKEDRATLINLNPRTNDWYLLKLGGRGEADVETFHLQNGDPAGQRLVLDSSFPHGLIIQLDQNRSPCDLWGPQARENLKKARGLGATYVPLCGERIYLLNPTKGHRTRIEVMTDFLRDGIPAGEKIVAFMRDTFYRDAYRETGKVVEKMAPREESQGSGGAADGPGPAIIDPQKVERLLDASNLGIQVRKTDRGGMVPGVWYPVQENPGIYAGVIAPEWVHPDIFRSYRGVVTNLDSVEATALVYLVAFDLGQFDLKFSLGTEHPRVNWSDRIPEGMKDGALSGPDGIGTVAPLVSTGLIRPRDTARTAAAFTGGFKRTHGAFKWGELAKKNHGSHYGFIESGVVFSKLQPGLSTIYRLDDGWVGLKTWSDKDRDLLPAVQYARQNGVPIISGFDRAAQMSVPGSLVSRWGEGNWSGSAAEKLRTLRAGAALQEVQGKRFFLYAVFTSATPSAMARVFQAYRCSYAMLLDMNALEHTYLAAYRREGPKLYVQHLIKGMEELDKTVKGQYIPRFLGYADNRDFFYLLRKGTP